MPPGNPTSSGLQDSGPGAKATGAGKLTRTLGALSVGLGLPALVAPDTVARVIGVRPTDGTTKLLRGVGLQELQVAAGLLTRPRPAFSQWSRVAGDVAHLALLAAAAGSRNSHERRVHQTMGVVGGIALVDTMAAIRLSRRASTAPFHASTAITVNRPTDEVYEYWRNFENLPEFMYHLESVEVTAEGRSRWVAKAPAGTSVKWDAEITEELPNELIAWRSLEGSKVANSGMVRFLPAPRDQGTEIHVELRYSPPGGRLGAKVAEVFGEQPQQQLRDDLRRFKQVLETGEVVRTSGSPDGTRVQRQFRQHPAQPLAEEGKH